MTWNTVLILVGIVGAIAFVQMVHTCQRCRGWRLGTRWGRRRVPNSTIVLEARWCRDCAALPVSPDEIPELLRDET